RFKYDLLFVGGDSDPGIRDREGYHRIRLIEALQAECPTLLNRPDLQRDTALLGELDCVREQVLQDLLEPFLIGVYRCRQFRIYSNREVQSLILSDLMEAPAQGFGSLNKWDFPDFDGHHSRLDLGQVEDVIDERKKIVPRRVNCLGKLDLA